MEGGRWQGSGCVSRKEDAAVYGSFAINNFYWSLNYTGIYSVFSTMYTGDAAFVLSGSDDGNVRMWKARASEKLGVVDGREKASKQYRDKLRERWKFDPEVGKVER